ncbi:TIGR03943 family putative permease subunit [Ectobacillus polymachus]|uniref:TIGR03943 family putative permease subunit n=1 Tax=Ectobacillus polymachus TaxID=1508806 RepID=UPI003A853B37
MSGIVLLGVALFLFEFLGKNQQVPLYVLYSLLVVCILIGSGSILISSENKDYFIKMNNSIHYLFVVISLIIIFFYIAYNHRSPLPQSKAKENNVFQLMQDAEETPQATAERPKNYEQQLENTLLQENEIRVDDHNYVSIMNVIAHDVEAFVGKQITFIGFVHKEAGLDRNQVVIVRYAIPCCGDDESVLGMITTSSTTASLQEGDWVRVSGQLGKTIVSSTLLPFVQAEKMEKVAAPYTPYVSETYSK